MRPFVKILRPLVIILLLLLLLTFIVYYYVRGSSCKVLRWARLCVCLCMCLPVWLCLQECLRNHTRDLYRIFCACCLWPWLGPPPASLRYFMYFSFCGPVGLHSAGEVWYLRLLCFILCVHKRYICQCMEADRQVEARHVLVPTSTRSSRRQVRRCTWPPWRATARTSCSWSPWAAGSRSWRPCWASRSSRRDRVGRTWRARTAPSRRTRTSRWNSRPCENWLQTNPTTSPRHLNGRWV